MDSSDQKVTPISSRVGAFDVVRGFSVLSMVLFHLCYDLKFISGVSLTWFEPPLQDIWRASISWTFLFVAGCMCLHSRSNLKRALQYGLVALAIWVATTIVAVDVPISYGIIYCVAACTLVSAILQRLNALPRGYVAAAVLFAAFLALQGLSDGWVGLGALSLDLPEALYDLNGLAWLGIPGPGFSSGDYYPLLPYLMMYLCGTAVASRWKRVGYPQWAREAHLAPLTFMGRHALAVYVIHQPLLLALCTILVG